MTATMTLPAPARSFGALDLFADCHRRDLRRIAALATTVDIPAGRVLCERGDVARECFAVIDGVVDVEIDGRHVALHRGSLVGEIALLTPCGRRTATVTTVTDMSALVFTRREFGELLATYPTTARKIYAESTRRLSENVSRS